MNTGKTLFAQLMDFLPWSTFDRIVARYNGNRAVRTLPCAAQYQVMAFARSPIARACATSKYVCQHNRPSSIIWVCEGRFAARRWPTLMKLATGGSTPSLAND